MSFTESHFHNRIAELRANREKRSPLSESQHNSKSAPTTAKAQTNVGTEIKENSKQIQEEARLEDSASLYNPMLKDPQDLQLQEQGARRSSRWEKFTTKEKHQDENQDSFAVGTTKRPSITQRLQMASSLSPGKDSKKLYNMALSEVEELRRLNTEVRGAIF